MKSCETTKTQIDKLLMRAFAAERGGLGNTACMPQRSDLHTSGALQPAALALELALEPAPVPAPGQPPMLVVVGALAVED
mmetsp:Transcript_99285/g.156521  ORF Transcript_99285/g.156521 Transcript_99285/m.156521 type:complete len:80 (+) Transcript_99285:120-359(+)